MRHLGLSTKDSLHVVAQRGEILLHHGPNGIEVDFEVSVNEAIAGPRDLPPGNGGLGTGHGCAEILDPFPDGTDPVGSGLVADLAHPGGNVTGVSSLAGSLAPQRNQLLREILPQVKRIGLIRDPTDPSAKTEYAALAALGPGIGVTLVGADASNAEELEVAFASLVRHGVDAIFTEESFLFNLRVRTTALANQQHLPVIGHRAQMADDGALFAYGAPLADQLRRSAQTVDKVLKGAKPADIPVEQPSLFELILNLKVARALGIQVPRSLVLRADRVIE
jgi:putative tryptophan/tyrosine transport system substrate-binding protein